VHFIINQFAAGYFDQIARYFPFGTKIAQWLCILSRSTKLVSSHGGHATLVTPGCGYMQFDRLLLSVTFSKDSYRILNEAPP
jgi:hypothetical protein